MNNFQRLVNRIATERRNRSNVVQDIASMQKSTVSNRALLKGLTLSMRKLNRKLTPTREEVRVQNRQRMDHFMKSLKHSVKTGSITSLEAIKAESAAHRVSTQLAARGLI